MQRRRESAAPAEAQPDQAPQAARVELFRRTADVPLGPRGAAVFRPVVLREQAAPFVGAGQVARAEGNGRRLAVGEGIRLAGEISACDRLVVHGDVSVVLEHVEVLEIGPSGRFDGRAQVAEAEIAGRFEGELTVTGRLLVCSTGVVEGAIRFGELEIERGGRLLGNVAASDAPAVGLATAPVSAGGEGN